MADIEHKDVTDPQIHEPKGAASAPSGRVYTSDGSGSGVWSTPRTSSEVGFVSYQDTATAITPIDIPGDGSYVPLTNNGNGQLTLLSHAPTGASDLWNVTTSVLDFSTLAVGDMVDIRVDMDVTTTNADQEFDVIVRLGAGDDLTALRVNKVGIGSERVSGFVSFPILSALVRTGGGSIRVSSGNAATVRVDTIYIKATINRS